MLPLLLLQLLSPQHSLSQNLSNTAVQILMPYSAAAQSHPDEGFSAADSPELARLSAKVVGGLRSLHLVCSTGVGSGLDTAAVKEVVCAAARGRSTLFTAKQCGQLESWLHTNKVFRSLYDGPAVAQVQRWPNPWAPSPD